MKEIKAYSVSVILDTRRKKESNKYPVKLSIYHKRKYKYYNLEIDLTEADFKKIWTDRGDTIVKGKNNVIRIKLEKFQTSANDEAEKLDPFSFEILEKKLFRKSSDSKDVSYHFNQLIESNIANGKIGTSESYKYTLKSLMNFNKGKRLMFDAITPKWLRDYESFMKVNGKSITSTAIYLRTLRSVFNTAIDAKDVSIEIYPFSKGKEKNKYKIPKSKKVKKALSGAELKILFDAESKTLEQEKARDFWFFSYACNGMNLKDIILLKHSDIDGDSFSYYRAKTYDKTTEKVKIKIHLNDYSKGFLLKYGSQERSGFIFPIVNNSDSDKEKFYKVKNFTRFINQHLKILAKDNGLPLGISTYWARHSFATNSIRKGASMEFVSDALNHSDLSVTKNYFSGFEDETKKEFANDLMNF